MTLFTPLTIASESNTENGDPSIASLYTVVVVASPIFFIGIGKIVGLLAPTM